MWHGSAHPCRQMRVLTMPRNREVLERLGHLRGRCKRCKNCSIGEATMWHSRGCVFWAFERAHCGIQEATGANGTLEDAPVDGLVML